MTLVEFCQAVAKWKEIRGEQVFDPAVSLALLTEELKEYLDADEALEAIDAAVDIAFVAAGAIWSSGYPLCETSLKSMKLFNEEMHIQFHLNVAGAINNIIAFEGKYLFVGNCYQIIGACYVHVCSILNSEALAQQAFEAIVVSNNTKTAEIIPIGEKYSPAGKGLNYVPPTETLKLIIAEAEKNGQKLH